MHAGTPCRLLNFQYQQVQSSVLGLPGKTHQGFTGRAEAVWPQLQQALDSLGVGTVMDILVVGNSLGGAVAQLLAFKLQVGGTFQLPRGFGSGAQHSANM